MKKQNEIVFKDENTVYIKRQIDAGITEVVLVNRETGSEKTRWFLTDSEARWFLFDKICGVK